MDLITQLNQTTSRLDKERILSQISLDDKKVLSYTYSPYKRYNLRFPEVDFNNLGKPTDQMFDILDGILSNKIARGNEARARVEYFAEDNGDLIKAIINKDLKCGVNATTINKLYPGLIPQFKVQLAKEVPIISLKYPLLAQIKYDGVRVIIINDNGKTAFYTRNGHEINIPRLKLFLDNQPYINYVLDGEMALISGKQEDRTKISGLINSAIKGGALRINDVRFFAFDFMTLSEWNNAECDVEYSGRYEILLEVLREFRSDHLVPAYTVELQNAEDALDYYNEILSEGYEGLILKSPRHIYTFKRSKDWVKVKETKTADLLCVNWTTAKQGKLEGGIGALTCTGIVEGRQVTVDVAGLTLIAAFTPPTEYLNQTIEVKYNSIIRNKEDTGWTLFLPRFSCIRFDK